MKYLMPDRYDAGLAIFGRQVGPSGSQSSYRARPVAMGERMQPLSEREAPSLITALLEMLGVRMPEALQALDSQVQAAPTVLALLRAE